MFITANLNDALKNHLLVAMSIKLTEQNSKEASEWHSLLDSDYPQACESILRFIAQRYAVSSLAWLERKGDRLETIFVNEESHLNVSVNDERLLDAAKREIPLELCDWQDAEETRPARTVHLFPIAAGSEISSALIIGDELLNAETKRHISRFCKSIASELEILRLREELNRRDSVERATRKFNENVQDIDTDVLWSTLVQTCADLLGVERGSLLVFNEKSNSLSAKAFVGLDTDITKKERENFGERIAQKVLRNGKPLIVEDVRKTEISAASADWSYKSNSFISYPIVIKERKIGVLNLTDRIGGENFGALDLDILNAITPQLAVLMDSAMLKRKAGEFEQLSVTDALTGLLNRYYLDERLPEEIRRSYRQCFSMSFLMIDVDDFKSYNDDFGHAEGDKALQLVANCLKDTLRGEDVAVRYGGEEFSILLPQTTSDGAAAIGERVREKVASTEFPNRQVTISVGVASCLNINCTAQKIIRRADKALYEAKRSGRNNVRVYENLIAARPKKVKSIGAETLQNESLASSANK